MKKLLMLGIVVTLLLIIPTVSFGLTSPSVSESHGVITGMFVTPGGGFILGAEYGLAPQFAIAAEFGLTEGSGYKLGVKYELNPNLALLGGLAGPGSNFFLGINGGTAFGKKLYGMGEVDLISGGGEMIFQFEAGAKYSLSSQLDIRAGVIGSSAGNGVNLEIGVGYKF
ncbi:MAG TPA: hypothetical protein VHY08_15855 [Bacillota bacterium]|nr:hypothetical protein [Bacillota bacterium]